jgi:hypothetical protein
MHNDPSHCREVDEELRIKNEELRIGSRFGEDMAPVGLIIRNSLFLTSNS